ncbi:hypothetical protein BJY01DRAFT_257160 [Aspergillus pseudoustus]|uniref:AAA+ ATPase domain-containing protein n=1 Tax=Aspergillus pseudoustus TaxID=1810923 RepID=A0ABR4JMA0_9EURO
MEMAVDNSDASAQLSYIRALEDRLHELERRMAAVESTGKRSAEATDSEVKSGDVDANGKSEGDENKERPPDTRPNAIPPFPPTISTIERVSFVPYVHHILSVENRPAIEVLYDEVRHEKGVENSKKFGASLAEVTPEKAIQMIKDAGVDSSESNPGAFRINSNRLARLLLSLVCDHQGTLLGTLEMQRPFDYPIFYHENVKQHLVELEASPKSGDDASLVEELRCYMRLMEDIIAHYNRFDTLSASDELSVHFEDLWHLFKPGETILYSEASPNPCASDYAKLKKSRSADQKLWRVYTRKWTTEAFMVKAYCIGHDGDSFICVKEWFDIKVYEGYASVTSLKVFPVRFASNGAKLLATAAKEGREFLKYMESKVVAHDGWALEPNEDAPTLRHVTGDVVIDFAETFKANPSWRPIQKLPSTTYLGSRGGLEQTNYQPVWYWIEEGKLNQVEELESSWAEYQVHRLEKRAFCRSKDQFLSRFWDEQLPPYSMREEDYHLLPSRLFGYSLQDRRFVSVSVSNLKPIGESSSRFQELIIEESHERMLRALVRSHFARKKIRDDMGVQIANQDIIQNKGKGLVILLHGVPGVGKTSTAEAMAVEFKKALLPMTCGDLGLEPEAVEDSLKELFRLAQTWDCILLLDEADVFLTERIPSDLRRNALVSVFLRVLDYYSGVLFLTTNRVGTIDEAFKSRIHISLYYPQLKKRQSEKIWEMNLSRLARIEDERCRATKEPPMAIDHDGILEFARDQYLRGREGKEGRTQWNGRQIRNAVLIASALARYDKIDKHHQPPDRYDLTADHFKLVVRSGLSFERYLYKVKGMTDGEVAFVQGIRADHANVNAKPSKGNGESGHDVSRNYGPRPATPATGIPPQMLQQQWPQTPTNAPVQPYNMHHGDASMQSPGLLSPGSHPGNVQQHQQQQQQQYSMGGGYPGQFGQLQMDMRASSPMPGSGQRPVERLGDWDSSDGF